MSDKEIVIIDYGVGNLFNIQRAFDSIGAKTVISKNREQIINASRLLLPGVGSFEAGIQAIQVSGIDTAIKEFAQSKKPLLGICLGMQLLLSLSLENGERKGLNLIEGKVLPFTPAEEGGEIYKVPQIGWNCLFQFDGRAKESWAGTVLENIDIRSKPYVYFLHSYYVALDNPKYGIAKTMYGQNDFCSVFQKDNISGCQFHPERSGKIGLQILKNFVSFSDNND